MTSRDLFVDTGAWYALADRSDQYHDRASKLFPSLLSGYRRMVTTNLVIAEAYILMRRMLGHGAALIFLEKIATSPKLSKVYSDRMLEEAAENILREYTDQDFSYTDAVSFAVMREHRMSKAFAFDRHFVTAGFTLVS